MLLKMNGHMSNGRSTKHINARYFMTGDRVRSGGVEVEHCLAERMWANVLNKALLYLSCWGNTGFLVVIFWNTLAASTSAS